MGRADMWMECFAGDARIEGDDAEIVADEFVAHANESHHWPYPEEALHIYAHNYAETACHASSLPRHIGATE